MSIKSFNSYNPLDLTLQIRQWRSHTAYSLPKVTQLWSGRATCARTRKKEEPGRLQSDSWSSSFPLPQVSPVFHPAEDSPIMGVQCTPLSLCNPQHPSPRWSLLWTRACHQEGLSSPSKPRWGIWVPKKLPTFLRAHRVSNEPGQGCRPGNTIPESSHPFTNQSESIYSAPATYWCQGVTQGIPLHLQCAYHLCSLIFTDLFTHYIIRFQKSNKEKAITLTELLKIVFFNVFLAGLGIDRSCGLSLVEANGGCSLVAMHGLLFALASLVVELKL